MGYLVSSSRTQNKFSCSQVVTRKSSNDFFYSKWEKKWHCFSENSVKTSCHIMTVTFSWQLDSERTRAREKRTSKFRPKVLLLFDDSNMIIIIFSFWKTQTLRFNSDLYWVILWYNTNKMYKCTVCTTSFLSGSH